MQCSFVMHLHPEDSDTFFWLNGAFFQLEALIQNSALPTVPSSSAGMAVHWGGNRRIVMYRCYQPYNAKGLRAAV